jgi:two-component system, NtrC family, sensor histidine kinase HydH
VRTEDAASMATERRIELRHQATVAVMILVLTSFHFATDAHAISVHDLLFKATFVPLILAGLWFPLRGALAWSALTSAVYLWHVFGDLSAHVHGTLWVGDIVLYNVVTGVTSFLSQRRAEALSQARRQARDLEENARALLRAEETLRRGERLRAMGELAAGLAHEIRNPLGGIQGAAEVLRREDSPREVAEEFWTLLESEVARLDGVVANFLQFARPPTPDVSSVRLRDLVSAVFLLLRPEAGRREIVCDNAVDQGVLVRADESLLRQILLNLMLNAVQVQSSEGRIRVSAQVDPERVVVDVADRGPGVPERLRDSLFDAYVTGRSEGTGLGLAVAVRLATSMRGCLELVSTGEAGSTFRVVLPTA